jgi:hypothetical protein
MYDMAAFAHAWAPLERRWEAEGAPAKVNRSVFCDIVVFGCKPG